MPMPKELKLAIQKMIDAGESEESIKTLIKEHASIAQPEKPPPTTYRDEPTTFAGGVMKSLMPGGSSDQAAYQGAKGYLKGAIADLPSSIGGALSSIGSAIMDPGQAASDAWEGIKAMPSHIMDTTMHAGSNPDAFGEMMGQMTGQPLVTEGLVKGAQVAGPPAIRAMGTPTEFAGKVGKQTGLFSGLLPPGVARWMEPSYVRMADRALGRGVEKIGKSMKNFGLEEPPLPNVKDLGNLPDITDMGNVPPTGVRQGQLMEPGARFGSDVMGDIMDYQNPLQPESTSMVPRPTTDMTTRGAPPTDASGRVVAPPQAEYAQRPAGPWDNNTSQAPKPPVETNQPITADSFGKDFFKTQGGNLTAKLRTQFATPQIVESLKAQGFRYSGLDKQGKMIFTKPQ